MLMFIGSSLLVFAAVIERFELFDNEIKSILSNVRWLRAKRCAVCKKVGLHPIKSWHVVQTIPSQQCALLVLWENPGSGACLLLLETTLGTIYILHCGILGGWFAIIHNDAVVVVDVVVGF